MTSSRTSAVGRSNGSPKPPPPALGTDPEQTSTELRRAEVGNGLLLSDSGTMPTEIEMISLCETDYEIRQRFDEPGLIGIGISGPFTAMRPIEWAAARMNSRFDRQLISRFLGLLSESEDAWTTLTTYIDCGAKISETAARLLVHENTVRYRLGRSRRSSTVASAILSLWPTSSSHSSRSEWKSHGERGPISTPRQAPAGPERSRGPTP
ncbi:helix-turn-helix domain-containing protein [Brevibacterium linens]|uniref:helix-turn-helix domain-containing protein n=1 Tax=Brevibacterium linens TaxID=1703 RepID=UPI003F89B977